MKIILLITLGLSAFVWADFSNYEDKSTSRDSEIEKIRKELNIDEPSAFDKKVVRIRKELNIEEPSASEKKLDRIREELNIEYEVPKKESLLDSTISDITEGLGLDDTLDIGDSFDDALSGIKETLDMEDEPEEDFSFANTMSDFQKTLGLEEGESWGMPSVFGFNKKKDHTVFGSTFLGDVKDTGTTFYKGMKYSGESAEFMSGMMYYNSKMYNTMFGVFDDSPFNIFEEEETSVFDVFEQGNSLMDMFE